MNRNQLKKKKNKLKKIIFQKQIRLHYLMGWEVVLEKCLGFGKYCIP